MICMDLSCPRKAAKAIVIDGRGKACAVYVTEMGLEARSSHRSSMLEANLYERADKTMSLYPIKWIHGG